jgi:putative endonuclease
MAQHNKLGKEGEQAAREYLIGKGFTVRETNWRMGHLEIDIVAHEPATNRLHIIEFKTRSGDVTHFDPMKSITQKKINNLVAVSNGYIRLYRLRMTVQYDVMFILGTPSQFTIQFIPNAFRPPLRSIR